MRPAILLSCLSLLAACSEAGGGAASPETVAAPAQLVPPPAPTSAPAGLYELEPSLSKIAFTVQYVDRTLVSARFVDAEAALQLEPADPERSSLLVTIETDSARTNIPGFDDLIAGPDFLDAGQFPKITFQSTNIVRTAAATAEVTGDLSLHGVTRPVTLKAAFDTAGVIEADHPRVRFTAQTTLRRSDFDLTQSLPMAGDPVGVVEQVQVAIDATFRRVNPTPSRVTESASGRR